MSDFLSRLVARSLEPSPAGPLGTQVRPRLASPFEPVAPEAVAPLGEEISTPAAAPVAGAAPPQDPWAAALPAPRVGEPPATPQRRSRRPEAPAQTADDTGPLTPAPRPLRSRREPVDPSSCSAAAPPRTAAPAVAPSPAPRIAPLPPPLPENGGRAVAPLAPPAGLAPPPAPPRQPAAAAPPAARVEPAVRRIEVERPPADRAVPPALPAPPVAWAAAPPTPAAPPAPSILQPRLALPEPLPERRGEPAAEPVIQVTIGRIEVRATPAPKAPARERPAARPALDLDEYLRQRAQGERR